MYTRTFYKKSVGSNSVHILCLQMKLTLHMSHNQNAVKNTKTQSKNTPNNRRLSVDTNHRKSKQVATKIHWKIRNMRRKTHTNNLQEESEQNQQINLIAAWVEQTQWNPNNDEKENKSY